MLGVEQSNVDQTSIGLENDSKFQHIFTQFITLNDGDWYYYLVLLCRFAIRFITYQLFHCPSLIGRNWSDENGERITYCEAEVNEDSSSTWKTEGDWLNNITYLKLQYAPWW